MDDSKGPEEYWNGYCQKEEREEGSDWAEGSMWMTRNMFQQKGMATESYTLLIKIIS